MPKNYCELIEKTIDNYFSEVTNYFFNPIFYETPPWEEHVPFPDPNEKSRKRISLLPHTTAASNIYLRVNRYSREFGFSEIVIKHDEQKQWEGILKNMLDFLKSQSSSIFSNLNKYLPPTFAQILDFEFDREYQLIFEDSKSIHIQVADVISGLLYKIWKEFKREYRLTQNSKEVMDLMFEFPLATHRSSGVNFVIPKYEYEKLIHVLEGVNIPWIFSDLL